MGVGGLVGGDGVEEGLGAYRLTVDVDGEVEVGAVGVAGSWCAGLASAGGELLAGGNGLAWSDGDG